jgi:hypothetical protein
MVYNHLAFASSVREPKLSDATYWPLDNLPGPKFCGAFDVTLPISFGKKRRYLRTNACTTPQNIVRKSIRILN